MANKGPNQRLRQRTIILMFIIFGLGFTIIIFRLGFFQLVMGEELKQLAVEQQLTDTTITGKRGNIYDMNGEILAESASVWRVVLAPAYFSNDEERAAITKGLADILDLDQSELFEKSKQHTYYVSIKRQIETDVRAKVLAFVNNIKVVDGKVKIAKELSEAEENLRNSKSEARLKKTIEMIDDYKRYYPHDRLASSVLGFTGSDDQGLWGIEAYYDSVLKGKEGRIIAAKNANSTDMPFQYKQNVDAEEGNSLTLTIDATIQAIVEKYVTQAVNDNNVLHKAAAVAMNPKTGAIYAMATCDKEGGYSLNDPFELNEVAKAALPSDAQKLMDADPDKKLTMEEALVQAESNALSAMWRNKAISDLYFPGSVFKMVTASMALEENLIDDDTTFSCTGKFPFEGTKDGIKCHVFSTGGSHGIQTFEEIIWHSCNPGFIQLGQKIGPKKFYEYYQAFGFSKPTGIDLPGESDDLFFEVTDGGIKPLDLATGSFGQNFGITPIQMATAASVIANGGNLVTPYVVQEVKDKNGNVIQTVEPQIKRQVISEETAKTMRGILEQNAVDGGARNGYVAGYRIAGKTGTTEKIGKSDVEGVMDYISSFCGFAPAEDPEIVVLLMFDTPKGMYYYGSMVAAPAFAGIMAEIAPYLEIEPRYTEEELETIDIRVESYIGLKVSDAEAKASSLNLTVTIKGSGEKVLAQIPETGSKIPAGGNVVFYTDSASASQMVKVPDFTGLTESEVISLAASNDINVSTSGAVDSVNAQSSEQSVAAGTKVRPGTVVTVKFVSNAYTD